MRKWKFKSWSIVILIGAILYTNRIYIIRSFQIFCLKSLACPTYRSDCKSIIWAHRVNSIEKYKELEYAFEGFETDITFVESLQNFMVFHPPLNNLQKTSTWNEFVNAIDLKKKKLYIDMRGVTSNNLYKALQSFESNRNTTELKKQTVIELYDYETASFFRQSGYNVSVSYSAIRTLLSTGEDSITRLKHVQDKFKDITQISGDIACLEEMKLKFPEKKYLTWSLSYKNYLNFNNISNNLADENVAIILISVLSSHNE